jgi:hypothetical protein
LTSLPTELGACTALQRLYCSNNQLSTLPVELGACTALQDLKHGDNSFEEGAPVTVDALRARFKQRRACAALVFCHEATRGSVRPQLGDVALDNVRDIARLLRERDTTTDTQRTRKVARWG